MIKQGTIKELIEEFGMEATFRKPSSKVPYIITDKIIINGEWTAVSARRKKVDGSLGIYTSFKTNEQFYYEKD